MDNFRKMTVVLIDMKIALFLLLWIVSFNTISVYAQDSSSAHPSGQATPHTLLWRISGKNGQKPSYLYGTMHLTDERVFNLGDSLYEAITGTDGFASELDPSDLSAIVLEEIKKEIVESKNIHQLLSDKDFKTYGPLLAKKLKKPQDKIDTRDILREKNKWMEESYRTGKMKTFLDVYLYDIARRQDKWTGGVEDLDDQRGLLNDVVDKSDIQELLADDNTAIAKGTEKMVDVYLLQDLDKIDRMVNGNGIDSVMLRRNKKMSVRMDSLSSVRSMVFAVGAAHLPGEQGVIQLLRRRGFQVDPVFSNKHIPATDYKVKEIPLTWSSVSDEDGMYLASMPGKPGNIQLYGVLNMKMYVDFFNGTGYFTTAVRSAEGKRGMDSALDVMAKNLFHTKNKNDFTPIVRNGAKGRMYTVKDEDGYKKGMVLTKDGFMYMAMGTSLRADTLQIGMLDRFLAEFKVLDISRKDSGVKVFTDQALAFRIDVPGNPKPYIDIPKGDNKNGWNSKLYITTDNQDGIYYLFGASSVFPGRFIDNDSSFFLHLKESSIEKLSSIMVDTAYFSDGYRLTEIAGKMKAADASMSIRYIARGNRWYALAAIYSSPVSGDKISRFMHSFTMLEYPAQNWRYERPADSVIGCWLPSTPTIRQKDSSDDVNMDRIYNSFDSSRSNSYSIIVSHRNPYDWSSSDSAFWAGLIAKHVLKPDSLVYKKPIRNGDARGWEWIELKQSSTMYEKERVLVDGDKFYTLFLCTPQSDIFSSNNNRFFEDFRFQMPVAKSSYLDSKAKALMAALFGNDSIQANLAFNTLTSAPFEKKDIGLLHQYLLEKPLLKNRVIDASRVNTTITRRIIQLKDSSSFGFAAENYGSAIDSSDNLKNNLLRIMAAFPSSEHFDRMADLLASSPPHGHLSDRLIGDLEDTMDLTAAIMPKLFTLFKDTLVCSSIIRISGWLLDSNRISLQAILPYQHDIVHYGLLRARMLSADAAYSYYDDIALIKLLGLFDNPSGNAVLKKLLSVKANYPRMKAAACLLKNRQEVSETVLLSLARDKGSRLDLYKTLKKAGNLALYPPVYKTQKLFAESEVYSQAYEDDEEPYSMGYITMRAIATGTTKKKYYFFKVKTQEDGDYYLGCAGPYDLDPSRLGTTGISAVINYKASFDPEHLKDQINQLLASFE
jgi:uncharacterized protein YbaP (TraB family)